MAIVLLMVFIGIGLVVLGWRSLLVSIIAMIFIVQILHVVNVGSGGAGGAAGIGAIVIVFAVGLVLGTIFRVVIFGLNKFKKSRKAQ
ncbi:hypothetical protein JWZ98_03530 [Methylomonas sp. EFPC1]|uniref:hypothetical protein n=1 Tax=Methylomonas sp. EFPC1 TaxID=2812647 RepID=UPI001967891B|nr:hypothetical protein [Methylomonas sp. EFPC1]QSB02045.1 hypothetical protein JWZ98_03530 [Methylomonas sp. EFPC1]